MSAGSGSRSAFVVGAGILISRVVGLLRQTAFAHYFGAGAAADAYNAAFKIPNALRNLFGEGTLSAAFVPVYARLLVGDDPRRARAMAHAVLGVLMAVTAALTLVGIFAAPLLTAVLTPGFSGPTAELTTRLTRILFPMTGLMVLSGWCLGVQNAHRRFFWSYASAALWSVAQIALLLVGGPRAADAETLVIWLAWATLVGAVMQVTAQWPEVRRLVGPVRPSFDLGAEGVRDTLRSVVPVVTALGVVQISSFVDLQIASMLPEGAPSVLAYANTLVLLPVSLFGVSVAASALPDLSQEVGADALDAVRERVRGGWQRILFYVVPSALAFVTLGDYCVALLFAGGRFGGDDIRRVHGVLAVYAIGLVSFASVKLLSSAHYALRDYRTPLRASLASLFVSAFTATAIALPWRSSPYAPMGIAAGSAIGSFVNLAWLGRGLRGRLGVLYTASMWLGSRRILAAALVASAVGGLGRWGHLELAGSTSPRLFAVPVLAVFGVAYLVTAWWLGSAEAARWLRRGVRQRT